MEGYISPQMLLRMLGYDKKQTDKRLEGIKIISRLLGDGWLAIDIDSMTFKEYFFDENNYINRYFYNDQQRYPLGSARQAIVEAADIECLEDMVEAVEREGKNHSFPDVETMIEECRNNKINLEPCMDQIEEMQTQAQKIMVLLLFSMFQKWYGKGVPSIYSLVRRYIDLDVKPQQKKGEGSYVLLGRYPQTRDIFVGREENIYQIHERFEAGSRCVFVHGIGGIGKSEIAKQYISRHNREYDTIVFAQYTSSILNLITDDDKIKITNVFRQENETAESYFIRKLEILQQISDEKTLIVIDDFNTDKDEKLSQFLMGKYRVIFTTRNSQSDYPVVEIAAIEDERQRFEIFEKNYGQKLDTEDIPFIHKIMEYIQYHTYAIELLAKQMSASFLSAGQLYEKLVDCSWEDAFDEKIEGREEPATAIGHICSIFRMSNLDETERRILRCLSVSGVGGIDAKLLKDWLGLENYETVNRLIKRSFVRKEMGRKISLHPLMIRSVWMMDEPDEDNISDFLKGMQMFSYRAWKRNVKENLAAYDAIMACVDYFDKVKGKMPYSIWSVPHFMWQVGDFDNGILYGHKIYERSCEIYGDISCDAGVQAVRLGACYYNTGLRPKSVAWYEKGLEILLEAGCQQNEDLALAYEKVARCYYSHWMGNGRNLNLSEEYFNKSLEIREKICSDYLAGREIPQAVDYCDEDIHEEAMGRLNQARMEIGRFYQETGEYEKALSYAQGTIDFWTEHDAGNKATIAYGYIDKGICFYLMAKSDKESPYIKQALEMFLKAYELEIFHRGELALDCVTAAEWVGDTYEIMEKHTESVKYYLKALEITRKLLGVESRRFSRIRGKVIDAIWKETGVHIGIEEIDAMIK